jgi:Cytochrome P450
MLIPVINERRKILAEGGTLDEDIITWMMELANEKEYPAENLAQRYIYTIIGSMHTVTAAVVDTIYDLCARPEYIPELREEVEQVLAEDGGWQKSTTNKMQKMDSFMKEVQRVNPPSARTYPPFKGSLDATEQLTLSHSGLQTHRQRPRGHYTLRRVAPPIRHLHLHAIMLAPARRRLRARPRLVRWLPLLRAAPRSGVLDARPVRVD